MDLPNRRAPYSATYPAVHDLLTTPGLAYAGAFVFGLTRTEKRVDPEDPPKPSTHATEWCRASSGSCSSPTIIPDISWEESRPTPHGCAAIGVAPANWPAARCARVGPCCRGCCGAGGVGGSCRPATSAPRATAHAMRPRQATVCRRARLPGPDMDIDFSSFHPAIGRNMANFLPSSNPRWHSGLTIQAQNSTVRIGADVDPDRFDTGGFGGRPTRGRADGAMPARVLNFPGGAAPR